MAKNSLSQNYHLTAVSRNPKTGPIPVSTTSEDSCPPICPLRGNGCYGEQGMVSLHWKKVNKQVYGDNWADFIGKVKAIRKRQLWRHNQVGDLPGSGNRINQKQLKELALANHGKRGFTYTHKPTTTANVKAIKAANKLGFTINLSGNSVTHADRLMKLGLPVVTVLPIDAPKHQTSPDGHKIISCPATYRDTDCNRCELCQKQDRSFIIGFPAHGSRAKAANLIATTAK